MKLPYLPADVTVSINLITALKGADKPTRVADLAPTLDTTEAFLQQIVLRLKRAGLVSVVRGPKGGVLPTETAKTVLDVFVALGKLEEQYAPNEGKASNVEQSLLAFFGTVQL